MAQRGGLLALAAALSLIGVVVGAARLLIKRRWLERVGVLMWMGAALMAEVGIVGATFAADFYLLSGSLLFGISLIAISLALLGFEIRAAYRLNSGDRPRPLAALGAAVGVLIGLSSVIVPVIPGQLAFKPSILPTATVTAPITLAPTRTPRFTATPTPAPSIAPTRTPLPSLTFTPSLTMSSTSTPNGSPVGSTALPRSGTAAVENTLTVTPVGCVLTVIKGVNVRVTPSADGKLLGALAIGATLPATARATVSGQTWWQVPFHAGQGWVIGGATRESAACAKLTAQS